MADPVAGPVPGPAAGPAPGWRPRLVALDIDGTLLRWVDGAGTTHEEISQVVYDAVQARTSCSPAAGRPTA